MTPALRELLQRLRGLPGLSANFVEEKSMALLAVPLQSSGELHFSQAAGQRALVRHTRKPTVSSLLLVGDLLKMGDQRTFQVIDLKGQPVVRLFVDSFVEILAGDEAALLKLYMVDFTGTAAVWKLRLVPRAAAVQRVIAQIEVQGRESIVDQIELLESNGDRTVTRFSQVVVGRVFTAAEKAEIFRLPPPPPSASHPAAQGR